MKENQYVGWSKAKWFKSPRNPAERRPESSLLRAVADVRPGIGDRECLRVLTRATGAAGRSERRKIPLGQPVIRALPVSSVSLQAAPPHCGSGARRQIGRAH